MTQGARGTTACALLLGLLLAAAVAGAQDATPPEGVNAGNYNIRQAVELGWRLGDFDGSRAFADTAVDLHSGARLFQQSLDLHSLDHHGLLLDTLSLSSFGFGGDPNTVVRLRAQKNRWYNLRGQFRRDRNFWDYNLFANPLNPANSNPSAPVTASPHRQDLVRRMSQLELTVLPQSRVRFRLEYRHNTDEGPSFSTFHDGSFIGTEFLLFQPWRTTLNAYHLGVDFKLLPRTNLSYDQTLQYEKGDSFSSNQNFGFQLSNGLPVDLGITFNTLAGQPCANPVVNPSTVPPTANPLCDDVSTFTRSARSRSSIPTEQFSFQSTYIRSLDLAGRVMYSSADLRVPFNELFDGFTSLTQQRQIQTTGPAVATRVTVAADMGATWQINDHLRLVDSFRFNHYRIPGSFTLSQNSLFALTALAAPRIYSPATCSPPAVISGCPLHNSFSPADIITESFSNFLGQDTRYNQFEVQYDFNRHIGLRVGHRYNDQAITQRALEAAQLLYLPTLVRRDQCTTQPLQPGSTCLVSTLIPSTLETPIRQHSLLAGLWVLPTDALRVNFDVEAMSADNTFTRVDPRQLQHYRLRASYNRNDWLDLSGSFNILESRNNAADVRNLQHNRSYTFSATVTRTHWSMDAGYDFNSIFSRANICYSLNVFPANAPLCPGALLLAGTSLYDSTTHSGDAGVMWKPVPRVTSRFGYTIVRVVGSTVFLDPATPAGPLSFTYHRPTASLAVQITRSMTWKSTWGYWSYGEDAPAGLTGPRDFRGNLVTVALRYAF